jgi:hypothetical protein
MSFRGRSPVYDPIQTPPKIQVEEPVKKSGFESSPLSRFISGEDIILVWTILAIVILIAGVFFYMVFGPSEKPPQYESSDDEGEDEVPAVGDDGNT